MRLYLECRKANLLVAMVFSYNFFLPLGTLLVAVLHASFDSGLLPLSQSQVLIEGLNGVNRQPSNGEKINHQPSKGNIFTVNRQLSQPLLTVKCHRFRLLRTKMESSYAVSK